VRRYTDDFLVVNDGHWGTTCAAVGCMPSKALIEAAHAFHRRLPDLLSQIPMDEEIGSVTADGAYDTRKCHDAIADRGAHAVIPPRKNAKPIERRVYEIARKFCGSQPSHKVGLEKLLKRTGARMPLKRFRHVIRDLAGHDHLPDYSVSFEEEGDNVVFTSRGSFVSMAEAEPIEHAPIAVLQPDTYNKARQAAPGWDVYVLEQDWRSWMTEPPRNPDGAFIGFCRKVFERRGRP
jgi:transposase